MTDHSELLARLDERGSDYTGKNYGHDPLCREAAAALREQARELDERQDNLESIQSRNEELVFERNRLASENAGLRKDAERYLWLRENWSEENPIKGRGGAVFPENPQEVDAAIDAAMEPK